MNDLGEYLRGLLRRTSNQSIASVVSRLPDGDYNVLLIHTQRVVRAARGQVTTELAPGQTVTVARPDGTGISRNTGYIIIAPAGPSAMKGTSYTTPTVVERPRTGLLILSVTPSRLILRKGEAGTITLYGTGFSASHLVTFSASGLTGSCTVVSETEARVVVRVGYATATGEHAVYLDGVALGVVVQVEGTSRLFVKSGSNTEIYNPESATLTALSLLSKAGSAFAVSGTTIYASSDGNFARINALTGAYTQITAAAPGSDAGAVRYADTDGSTYWSIFSGQIAALDCATGATLASAAVVGTLGGVYYDGSNVYLSGAQPFRRYDASLGSAATLTLSPAPSGSGVTQIVDDGTYLYFAIGAVIYKVTKATFTQAGSLTDGGAAMGLAVLGDYLYFLADDGASQTLHKINPATMTVVSTVSAGAHASTFGRMIAADGLYVWVPADGAPATLNAYDGDLVVQQTKTLGALLTSPKQLLLV